MGHLVQPPPVSKTRSIQRGRGTATLSRAALKTTCTFATYLPRTPSSKLPPSNSIAVRERGNSSAPASLTYFQRLNGLLLLVGGGEQLLRPLLCAPGTGSSEYAHAHAPISYVVEGWLKRVRPEVGEKDRRDFLFFRERSMEELISLIAES